MSYSRRTIIKGKKRTKRRLIWITLPLLIFVLSIAAYGAFLYNKAESVMVDSYKPLERENKAFSEELKTGSTSVLIIGVDDSSKRGFSSSARSDALMLATFNNDAKSIKLLSIPRDSYVDIPKIGRKDKINHAHALGGPISTIETVEGLLDIPIDFYVKVNFNAFIDIVDALGGIEVEIPYTFSEQNSRDEQNSITLQKGLQDLNGEEALALARTRKLDNDIERGKRQQEILKAIIKKSLSASSVTKYASVIEAVGSNMETDLSFEQMKTYFDYIATGSGIDIQSLSIEGQDLWLENKNGNRVYYYELNSDSLDDIKSTLQLHLGLANTVLGTNKSNNIVSEQTQSNNP